MSALKASQPKFLTFLTAESCDELSEHSSDCHVRNLPSQLSLRFPSGCVVLPWEHRLNQQHKVTGLNRRFKNYFTKLFSPEHFLLEGHFHFIGREGRERENSSWQLAGVLNENPRSSSTPGLLTSLITVYGLYCANSLASFRISVALYWVLSWFQLG